MLEIDVKDLTFVYETVFKQLACIHGVCVNLRPAQKALLSQQLVERAVRAPIGRGVYVHTPVHLFLKRLTFPTKVAMLFQSPDGQQTITAVVKVTAVSWAREDDYPHLAFARPEYLCGVNPPMEIGGALILAIAKVLPERATFVREDQTFEVFVRLVRSSAIPNR